MATAFLEGKQGPLPQYGLVFNEKLNDSWGKRHISHTEALATHIGMGENQFSSETPSKTVSS